MFYNAGYSQTLHAAGLRRTKTAFNVSFGSQRENLADQPEMYLGVAGAGAGLGAGVAGHRAVNYTKGSILADDTADKLREYKRLTGSGMSLGEYADMSSDLLNQKMPLRDGSTITGQELVKKVRTGKLSPLLQSAGLLQPFDSASEEHYKNFSEGPLQAAKHMFRETEGADPEDFRKDFLRRRYETARQMAATLPEGTDVDSMPVDGKEFRRIMRDSVDNPHLSFALGRADRHMESADPEQYVAHLRAAIRGDDAGHIQDDLYRKTPLYTTDSLGDYAERKITQFVEERALHYGEPDVNKMPASDRRAWLNEILEDGAPLRRGGSGDPILEAASVKMKPTYQDWAKQYTGLIDPVLTRDDVLRKINTGGRAARIAGLAAAGLGAGLAGKSMYDTSNSRGFGASIQW
jgi:hypothetical protein